MTGIVLSFLACLAIPAVFVIAGTCLAAARGRPKPAPRSVAGDAVKSALITAAITLGACFVLKWTGFIDRQFFRPSDHDWGRLAELGVAAEDVTFESRDGTKLHGLFIAADAPAVGTVVHLHGSDRNVSYTAGNAAWLAAHRFNVFAFDYRGYGKSEGSPTYEGVIEDAAAALRYVRSRPDVPPGAISLWGQSMGGQLAIKAAAADDGNRGALRAVVAEATYASHAHHTKDKIARLGPLWLVQWGAWLAMSDANSARHDVGTVAPIPLLLVHGTADTAVLPYQSTWLYEEASAPKDIWLVEGAEHLRVFQDETMRARLVEFLRRASPDPGAGASPSSDGARPPSATARP